MRTKMRAAEEDSKVRRGKRFFVRRVLRNERGSSLVEVALVLSLLFVPTLVGIVEFANLAYASIEISNAAHTGAAYVAQYYEQEKSSNSASITLPTATQVTSVAEGDSPDLQKLMASGNSLTVAMATGCGTGTATSGNTIPSCTAPTLPYVQVTAQALIVPMVHLPGFAGPFPISTTATMNLVN